VSQRVTLAQAAGRVLAEAVIADCPAPVPVRAADNGYAVRASDCDGAASYNPLVLTLLAQGINVLPARSTCPIVSGGALPTGANAVLPVDAVQPDNAGQLEVLTPVAPGTGIERWWQTLSAAVPLLPAGHRLRPQDIGGLAAVSIDGVTALSQPRVAVVLPGPKYGADMLAPMLTALLARDGALVELIPVASDDLRGLQAALTSPRIASSQCVLLAGRSGTGLDDIAPLAITGSGGALALHGVALRPGNSSGMGILPATTVPGKPADTVPIVLLPGQPLACLVAYDLLASRLVRRLAGMASALPYPVADVPLARKIASELGSAEIVPVRLTDGLARPIGADGGLIGALQADGFVLVSETSEGYPANAHVPLHLYQGSPAGVTANRTL
jgi:molybdopterin molybdotransferase